VQGAVLRQHRFAPADARLRRRALQETLPWDTKKAQVDPSHRAAWAEYASSLLCVKLSTSKSLSVVSLKPEGAWIKPTRAARSTP
jgi:hypothetical protein